MAKVYIESDSDGGWFTIADELTKTFGQHVIVDNNYTDSNTRSKFYYLTRFRFLGHMEIVCFDCNSKVHWRHPFMTRKLAWWLLDRKCDRNEKKQWKQTLKESK